MLADQATAPFTRFKDREQAVSGHWLSKLS